jgi:hypothetical protein
MVNKKTWNATTWKHCDVYLEPIKHIYIEKKEPHRTFKSVSSVLHMVEPVFEVEKVALAISRQSDEKRKPQYVGLSYQDILDLWVKINFESTEYGTAVHNYMEHFLLSNGLYKAKDEFESSLSNAWYDLDIDTGQTMYCERTLHSHEYYLSGTSDIIIDYEYDFFGVFDFKTNENFTFHNPYNQMLLKPLEYLNYSKYAIYTIQLSIYAFLYQLEFPTKKVKELAIIYWDRNEKVFKKYPCIYLKDVAAKLVNNFKYDIMKNS